MVLPCLQSTYRFDDASLSARKSEGILEYGIPVRFEQTQFQSARWLSGPQDKVDSFMNTNKGHMALDHDGDPVFMTRLQWDIDRVERDFPELTLTATKDIMV